MALVSLALAAPMPAHAISWSVDPGNLLYLQSALALDGSGDIHLALINSAGNIKYRKRVGGTYGTTENVDGGSGRTQPHIALDGSGTPNVVYNTGTSLYFAKRFSATQWGGFVNNSSPDLVATINGLTVGTVSFALDPSGNPHVLYNVHPPNAPSSTLRHAWHDASGWHVEDVFFPQFAAPADMAFDASGILHLAFAAGNNGLWYQIKDANGWNQPSRVQVFSGAAVGSPSIALLSSGQPCIAFTTIDSPRSLRYVARGTSGWGTPVVIDNTSDVGAHPHLAMEGDLARITYWHRANWDVRSAWQCADGSWDLATIDAAPIPPAPSNEPGFAWLALRSNGAPVVYYSDLQGQVVKNASNGAATAISTLTVGFGNTSSATTFTLPTDCSGITTPLAWEVRVAGSPITTEAAWNAAATLATGSDAQGTTRCILQSNLPECTSFYFAAKYTNRYGVPSGLSNSAGGKTRCTGFSEADCGPFAARLGRSEDAVDATVLTLFVRGPNPATSAVGLGYVVPASGVGAPMRLGIFDVSGRLVRGLESGAAQAGQHEASWNLLDDAGHPAARGLYFARFVVGNEVRTRTLIVNR